MAQERLTEEWRPRRGGDYEVSSLGRVRRARPGRRTFVGRLMTPVRMAIGYLTVAPTVNGKNKPMWIHAMVAESFLGPRPADAVVNHLDGDKTNNCVGNLEYTTHAGNMRHARRTGLSPVGERCGNAKLTGEKVLAMRQARRDGEALRSIAARFGVAPSTASQAINARHWGHL